MPALYQGNHLDERGGNRRTIHDINCVGRYHEWEQRRGCFGSCIPTTWNKLSEKEDNDLHQTIGLAAKQHRNLVLMGDFNYPNIQWGSRRTDKVGAKFLELIDDCYLHQHVTEPTRYGNILDLVFSSEADMIEDVDVREPAVNSDHCTIHFKLVVRRQAKNNPDRQTRDYNRG